VNYEKKQIIIFGMHRCGKLILARLVSLVVAYLGCQEVHTGANRKKPKGVWERRDIRELNDLLLTPVGSDWGCVAGFGVIF
jgi:hypothetical protein